MRYQCYINSEPSDICAKTKHEIEDWINTQIDTRRLDWRVGFLIKFSDTLDIYDWVEVKTGAKVRCW
jgi:hypothetical protein